jgi:D-serine deaminase-like pyridoxal phosphate-dependent protein
MQNNNMLSIDTIHKIDSPALVIFPGRVLQNIRLAIAMLDDVSRLRPHVKTNKSPDATRMMIGEGIHKFKCATIAEAEMLGQCGAKDVLLAYQPIGPKLQRFIQLVQQYPGTIYSCLTDHPDAAYEQATAFAAAGLVVPVFIDLNLGMNRTGIAPDKTLALYQRCAELPGIRPVGLQAYDGHLRHPDIADRTMACDAVYAGVEMLRGKIVAAGFAEPVIVAGGSPTYPIHARRAGVECSPGTFIYWDKGYGDLCSEQAFVPAAYLMTRIISLPDAEHLCLDLGHKSVAAENPLHQRVFFENAQELTPVGQSEEHLVVHAGAGHTYRVGDVLWGVPFHICPTVALYERAITVVNEAVSEEWMAVARDRKLSI